MSKSTPVAASALPGKTGQLSANSMPGYAQIMPRWGPRPARSWRHSRRPQKARSPPNGSVGFVLPSLWRTGTSERVDGCGLDGGLRADDWSYLERRSQCADLSRRWHLLQWSDGVGHRIVRRARGDWRWRDRARTGSCAVAARRATGVATGVTASVATPVQAREQTVPAAAGVAGGGATTASGSGGGCAYGGRSGLAALSGGGFASGFASWLAGRGGAGCRRGAWRGARSGGTGCLTAAAATMMRATAQTGEESAAPALATGITGGAAAAVTTGCAGRNDGRSRVLHLGDAGCLVRAGRPSRGYQEQRSIHSEDLQGGWVARVRGGWREPTAGSSRPVPVRGFESSSPPRGSTRVRTDAPRPEASEGAEAC
jgi:hypothetical protein